MIEILLIKIRLLKQQYAPKLTYELMKWNENHVSAVTAMTIIGPDKYIKAKLCKALVGIKGLKTFSIIY